MPRVFTWISSEFLSSGNSFALVGERNGRLRVSQNGDFEPPAGPQIEALVLHLELKNEDSTPSIEGRPRCPADFVK
ncbi:hypothetical protein TNCT_277231 [Trichonephila clavata]|uniref:Uncharacterized protein n=1 Tax=Trichonephila clavata TaxID=2740835 RepID=A0A8X6L2A7_TRICU|nr:hypothetical protein TNCT_277231 [Trichonephila clavata]